MRRQPFLLFKVLDASNYADCMINFYPDCLLLVRMGRKTGSKTLTEIGGYLYRSEKVRSIHDNFYRQIRNVFETSTLPRVDKIDFAPAKHLSVINVFAMHKNDYFGGKCL